jgi:hexosaminidase
MVALCLLLMAGLTAYAGEGAGSPPAIIPAPVKLQLQKGHFVLGPNPFVSLETRETGARWVGDYLCTLLGKASARVVPLRVEDGTDAKGAIHLSLGAPARLGPQGYELNVSPHSIRIRAAGVAGLFYGVQTLRQMLPPEIETGVPHKGPLAVPCLAIGDAPRFAWRGLMLDCSRTFLPVDYLRLSLDRMALYKLNVLHLHLTDDQGWRLEIKKYPKLTSVGAHFAERYGGGGGFYSQQEMRELIAYAQERNITIVPEVEIPGHSMEVLAAYPELACDLPGQPVLEVHPFFQGPQGFSPPLCAGNERVFEMFGDVLSEVADLFPSAFIHVGGDEVPKDSWNKCPRCQARIKEEGLKDSV